MTEIKNFDEARTGRDANRSLFQIGGQTFTTSADVHPDDLKAFDGLEDNAGITETLEIVDRTLLAMIADEDGTPEGGHARFRAVRESRTDIISVADLLALAEWLIGAQADRPTGPSSPSSDGPGNTGPSLMGVSSSPVESAV